jgi:hypothetical protein
MSRRGRSTEVLEERNHRGQTIVLGKDKYQYMIGVRFKGKGSVRWKRFITDLPPADKFGGKGNLAKAMFLHDDPFRVTFEELTLKLAEITGEDRSTKAVGTLFSKLSRLG